VIQRLPVLRRILPMAVIVAGVLLVVGGIAFAVFRGMDRPVEQSRKVAQQVTVIRPPPPPPEAAPPPPPEVKEEVKLPEPEPEPDNSAEPPPGDQLGLDADGVAGGDAFGLAARPGGRDLLAGGGAGAFDWYRNAVGSELLGRLAENRDIRRKRYSVALRLWLAADGRIERFKLDGTTGDSNLDQQLATALGGLGRISEVPPEGLPQPVRLRIVSRS
jgi:periplasmic protein TonB